MSCVYVCFMFRKRRGFQTISYFGRSVDKYFLLWFVCASESANLSVNTSDCMQESVTWNLWLQKNNTSECTKKKSPGSRTLKSSLWNSGRWREVKNYSPILWCKNNASRVFWLKSLTTASEPVSARNTNEQNTSVQYISFFTFDSLIIQRRLCL